MREKIEAFFNWLESEEGQGFLLYCESGQASARDIIDVVRPFAIDPLSILTQCFLLYMNKVKENSK